VGGHDPYSLSEVLEQFEKRQKKPDLIIDAGRLPKRKPSTFVQVIEEQAVVLREGPIKEKEIIRVVAKANMKTKKR
jgi:tRNA A37 threonylcarbamoyladenosine synthetase subunit TsaC/SUA5/YrdC